MIFLIHFLLAQNLRAIVVDADKRCDCIEIQNQYDCNRLLNCRWISNSCQERIYQCVAPQNTDCNEDCFFTCEWNDSTESYNAKAFHCQDFQSKIDCERVKQFCYWKKDQTCDKFAQCTDYDVDSCPIYDEQCQILNDTCVAGWSQCKTHTSSTTCNGRETLDEECLWGDDKVCKSQYINDCSSLTGFSECNINYVECKKDISGNCVGVTCSDKSQITCGSTRIVQKNSNKYYLCRLDNNLKCQEATDTSYLTQSNCQQQTAANYKWVDNKCQVCKKTVDKLLDSQKDGYVELEQPIVINFIGNVVIEFLVINIIFLNI